MEIKKFVTNLGSRVAGVGLAVPTATRDSEGVLESIRPDFVLCVSNRAAVQPGRAGEQPINTGDV